MNNFFKNYILTLSNTLDNNHFNELILITKYIKKIIIKKKNIFVCGNGGSASIANHFLCDFNKGTVSANKNALKARVISLANSNELITAIGNDISFDQIYSFQLQNLANKGDCLFLMSCSGTSKNIIEAARVAIKKNVNIVSLIGFADNIFLKNNSKYYINLNVRNYGICEDIFQIIMHMISQLIYLKKNNYLLKLFK
jgi:phosphoheptose isomerase